MRQQMWPVCPLIFFDCNKTDKTVLYYVCLCVVLLFFLFLSLPSAFCVFNFGNNEYTPRNGWGLFWLLFLPMLQSWGNTSRNVYLVENRNHALWWWGQDLVSLLQKCSTHQQSLTPCDQAQREVLLEHFARGVMETWKTPFYHITIVLYWLDRRTTWETQAKKTAILAPPSV